MIRLPLTAHARPTAADRYHRRPQGPLDLDFISVAALSSGGSRPASIEDEPPLGQWFVLHHHAEDRVQLELSEAAGIDEQGEDRKTGQFTDGLVRVMLNPYQPGPAVAGKRPLDVRATMSTSPSCPHTDRFLDPDRIRIAAPDVV